ncbi:AAA family ATPase [Brucella intermedia]|uniref:AAA family ATPase n=1 Tax=Brucella intermedia TaxID=94625 RepID=UPI00209B2669|nr:AAA family ATPase [Brucella intermedia]MCO7737480.1 AAA family ATPase [Brucella intermedia]
MKIDRLYLENYRGIDRLVLEFDPEITVIVGRNGAGKSSILDATAALLKIIQFSWRSDGFEPLGPDASIPLKDKKRAEQTTFVSIKLNWEGDGGVGFPENLNMSSDHYGYHDNPDLLNFWNHSFNGGLAKVERPLMVYYRQDRGFESNGGMLGDLVDKKSTIITSLEGELKAISHLESWWDRHDAQEARTVRDVDREFRDPQLEAIRKLITEIDGFKGVTYSSIRNPVGLYFHKDDGSFVHVSMLSSGERSFIILLADLARRLQLMKPDASLSDIPGIVLIDEIELNLHPAWQSKILVTLRHVFKKCQFVISTHSPQVISSIEREHVRILERNTDGIHEVKKPLKTKGQTSNYLLEGVFGAHERFPESDRLIDRFNDAIDSKNLKQAELLLEQIRKQIEGDPPELLLLMKRLKQLRG